MEATIITATFPVHDPDIYDDEEVQLGWCKRCLQSVGTYHLAGCIYGGFVDPLDCVKFADIAPFVPGLSRELARGQGW